MTDSEPPVYDDDFETEDTSDDTGNEESGKVSENKVEVATDGKSKDAPTEETNADTTQEQPQLTDKGTRLDPNPLSAANQRAANAERRARDLEQFMTNPQEIVKYAEEMKQKYGLTQQQTDKVVNELTADKIETVEDLQKFASNLDRKYEQKFSTFEQQRQNEQARNQAIRSIENTTNTIASDLNQVQAKYPELREKNTDGTPNPDFDPNLAEEVFGFWNDIDFDPNANLYQGRVRLSSTVDRFMKARNSGVNQGVKKAQTQVVDKRIGANRSTNSQSKDTVDTDNMSSSEFLAYKMKQVQAQRRQR